MVDGHVVRVLFWFAFNFALTLSFYRMRSAIRSQKRENVDFSVFDRKRQQHIAQTTELNMHERLWNEPTEIVHSLFLAHINGHKCNETLNTLQMYIYTKWQTRVNWQMQKMRNPLFFFSLLAVALRKLWTTQNHHQQQQTQQQQQ